MKLFSSDQIKAFMRNVHSTVKCAFCDMISELVIWSHVWYRQK